jgi:hypothetical protein
MPENLFVVTDPLGREVRLTENCYQYHIVVEHPEIADVEIIEEVVTLPDLIAQDAVNRDRLVYYREYQQNPQRWYKVVVEGSEVVTVYRVGRLKRGETPIWPQ